MAPTAPWIPWLLDYMDIGRKKHHMWVRPKFEHALPGKSFGRRFVGIEIPERCRRPGSVGRR